MKGSAAVALVLPLLVLAVPFVDLFLIVWRRWRRGVPFYAAGQDHVHHDLVLVHGFSQRKSVLLLYTWCVLLSGLGIAMQRGNKTAMIVLGVVGSVATAYMARLLSRYRERSLELEPVPAEDLLVPSAMPSEGLSPTGVVAAEGQSSDGTPGVCSSSRRRACGIGAPRRESGA